MTAGRAGGLRRSLSAAIDSAYEAVDGISFEGAQVRRDIGARALG